MEPPRPTRSRQKPFCTCTAAQFFPLTNFDSSLLLRWSPWDSAPVKFLNANPHLGVFPGNTKCSSWYQKYLRKKMLRWGLWVGARNHLTWRKEYLPCCTHAASGDINSLTRDGTYALQVEVQCLNHWTAREVPKMRFLKLDYPSGWQ